MAVVRVFDKNGVKTLEMMGNANEQSYDEVLDYPVEAQAEDKE